VFLVTDGKYFLIHISRRASVIDFDHETVVKRNLPILTATTGLDFPDRTSILFVLHNGIYQNTANHSLLSEFQFREIGIMLIQHASEIEESKF
jgi:hypothetical protein